MATHAAAHGTPNVPHSRAQARGRVSRVSLAQLRAARRILGILVVIELGVLAARLLELAGFDPLVSFAAMGALTANLLATWLIIAHANRGRTQRRFRSGRTPPTGHPPRASVR